MKGKNEAMDSEKESQPGSGDFKGETDSREDPPGAWYQS